MDNTKRISILVLVTLSITLLNVYMTYDLNHKFDSIFVKAGAQQDVQPTPKQQQPPTADSSRVDASIGDNPIRGSKDSPVTIIEFSDYQCPYCEKFFTDTLPLIEKNYIKTGEVRFVYRDFPLGFHQYAEKAAEASECADDQGKFWEYHDELFKNQKSMEIADLKQYAKDLALDVTAFNNCLDSGKKTAEVQKDIDDGLAYDVSGTPTFFINGIKLVGAQPYSVFQQVIDKELNGKKP